MNRPAPLPLLLIRHRTRRTARGWHPLDNDVPAEAWGNPVTWVLLAACGWLAWSAMGAVGLL